jgi:hypothetical protein
LNCQLEKAKDQVIDCHAPSLVMCRKAWLNFQFDIEHPAMAKRPRTQINSTVKVRFTKFSEHVVSPKQPIQMSPPPADMAPVVAHLCSLSHTNQSVDQVRE